MNKIDKIIVVSKAKMDSLIREYNLNPDKLVLINNCVDIDKFMDLEDKDELKRKTGISCGEKVIGMVGRLVNEKAYDIFLKSAQRINRRIPDTKFLIIGDGIERQGLERLALSLGIEKQVIFLGERQDVPRIITLFDVAVLSSRIESFPVTLLEYMAASRPIVATNVGGNTEIVIDGKTGCIIPPEDPEALSDAVIALLNNRRKAEEMGRAAKRIVEDEFSLNHMINKMERLFLSCANESSTCLRGIPHLLASRRSRGKPRVRAGMPASNSWQGLTIGGDSERNSASARFSPRRSEKKESTGVSPWSFKLI
jgi:glycosyltransferase involved in cell wall biosynthesis